MSKKRKQVKQVEHVSDRKVPKSIIAPNSFYSTYPIWSFKNLDTAHQRWGMRDVQNIYQDIIIKLKDFEGLTWGEIIKANGARSNGNNNHFESVSSLVEEAQKRWVELKLEEYGEIFSLHLTSVHRLYGILQDGVFRIVWYDENHEIYKVTK